MSVDSIIPGEWYVRNGKEAVLGVCGDKYLIKDLLEYRMISNYAGANIAKIENNMQGWDWKPEPAWVNPTEDHNRFVACRYQGTSDSPHWATGRFVCMADGNSPNRYIIEDNDGRFLSVYVCEIQEQS